MSDNTTNPETPESLVKWCYFFQIAGYLLPLTFLIAVIIGYAKREDVKSTWLEGHVTWQIRTFWYGLAGAVISFATWMFGVGIAIWVVTYIGVLYRIIRGLLAFYDGKVI